MDPDPLPYDFHKSSVNISLKIIFFTSFFSLLEEHFLIAFWALGAESKTFLKCWIRIRL
jgi:hypothetical protein